MASRPDALPTAPQAADVSRLAALLQFEAELRRQPSIPELIYFLANESRRLLDYDQMFVLRQALVNARQQVVGVSSIATVDRNAPFIGAVEAVIDKLAADTGLGDASDVDALRLGDDPSLAEYPFKVWRWQPLNGADGTPFGGLVVARRAPLLSADTVRLERIAETAAHAWRLLAGDRPVRRLAMPDRRQRRALAIVAAVVALFPVQMSALAPAEVVAARPYVIAAPFAGVVERIHVAPNSLVKQGTLLVSFEDVKLRNELTLAERRLAVARARVERATSAAFDTADEAREIAIAAAERDLAAAEHAFARDMLGKSRIVAPRAGMALYSDRRDFEGRALNVGEAILSIAAPDAVALRIDLPAAEQMQLKPGARVKLWLDAQPLWAIEGRVETMSFTARPTTDNVLAFSVRARLTSDTPSIGSRGTAKLYGRWTPLCYALLRRPIAAARQFFGL
jgi:hypothetical protein